MKNIFFVFLISIVTIVSCNKEKSCACEELENPSDAQNVKKGNSTELYTGICVKLDQNDSIVEKNVFRNGWKVKKILREKIDNSYVIIEDSDWYNGKRIGGYGVVYDDYTYYDYDEKNSIKIRYTSMIYRFSQINGEIKEFDVQLRKDSMCMYVNCNEMFVEGNLVNRERPKYFDPKENNTNTGDYFYCEYGNQGWVGHSIHTGILMNIFKNMKSEVAHFDYFVINDN